MTKLAQRAELVRMVTKQLGQKKYCGKKKMGQKKIETIKKI
jgi:hypothetical protein